MLAASTLSLLFVLSKTHAILQYSGYGNSFPTCAQTATTLTMYKKAPGTRAMLNRFYLMCVDGHCEAWGRWTSREPSSLFYPPISGILGRNA